MCVCVPDNGLIIAIVSSPVLITLLTQETPCGVWLTEDTHSAETTFLNGSFGKLADRPQSRQLVDENLVWPVEAHPEHIKQNT